MAATTILEQLPKVQKYVGKDLKRKEDIRLITGKGGYVDDLNLVGALYVTFARSPYPHAKILKIDTSKAWELPGVVDIVTATEAKNYSKPLSIFARGERIPEYHCLASKKVRFVGQAVAAVAAIDRYIAEDAVEKIEVEYELLPPVVDLDKAMSKDSTLLYEEWGHNFIYQSQVRTGDVEAAFRKADLVVSERVRSHRYTGVPIETQGCVAFYDKTLGTLTLWLSAQKAHLERSAMASLLDIPENKIRVIIRDVGGGFGNKGQRTPEYVACSIISIRTGLPVKWIQTRTEWFQSSNHGDRDQIHYIDVAVRADGVILAVKDKVIADAGSGTNVPFMGTTVLPLQVLTMQGPYKIKNWFWDLYAVVTNKGPSGAYRGFGQTVSTFALERAIDIAADKLKMDRVEIRLKNMLSSQDMPYKNAVGVVYDSGDPANLLKMVVAASRYNSFEKFRQEMRELGKYVGIGISCNVEAGAWNSKGVAEAEEAVPGAASINGGQPGFDIATIRLDPSGLVTVLVGTQSQGMGHETTLAQVVADELGVDVDKVVVKQGDSDMAPYGLGTWGSRTAPISGGSCFLASRKLKTKVLALASYLHNTSPSELGISKGTVVDKEGRTVISIRELCRIAFYEPQKFPREMEPALLEATAYFDPELTTTSGNNASIAIVEVDLTTYNVKILEYFSFDDSGSVINPMIVDGQVMGGIAQGIGGTLLEDMPYDENGQPQASTFMDYLIPTAMDIPKLTLGRTCSPSPFIPGGFKGAGEGGVVHPPQAICSAVEDALRDFGIKVLETPLTPDYIRKLCHNSPIKPLNFPVSA